VDEGAQLTGLMAEREAQAGVIALERVDDLAYRGARRWHHAPTPGARLQLGGQQDREGGGRRCGWCLTWIPPRLAGGAVTCARWMGRVDVCRVSGRASATARARVAMERTF